MCIIFSCRYDCLKNFTEDNMLEVFNSLHSLSSKTEQDIYIQSLMELEPIARKRPRSAGESKPKAFNVKYCILLNGVRSRVCKKAFIQTYNYTKNQIERLSHLLQQNKTPEDKRGKGQSANTIPEIVQSRLKEHIESFPTKVSHYSNSERRYLAANLNQKVMYEMFIEKERDFLLATLGNEKRFSYKYFSEYFKTNFDLGFGRPQVDACVTCEELQTKIKSPVLNENAKKAAVAELIVHKRKAKKFYHMVKSITEVCKHDTKTVAISIDFMANVCLPTIPVQDIYYFRQLTVNVFGIHDFGTRKMTAFVYHEGNGGKGSNDVCTMIRWYIDNAVNSDVENLYIFGDNCSGQNKNNTLLRFVMALTETKRFKNVTLYFPQRGHSFMPNDRDFGVIKRKLRQLERYYTVDEVIEGIVNASKDIQRFTVVKMDHDDFLDYSSWWPKFYKRTTLSVDSFGKSVPREQKRTFQLSTYYEFKVKSEHPERIICSNNINGLTQDVFRLRNLKTPLELPDDKAYKEKRPINIKKMEDLKKTKSYIPFEKMSFWDDIFMWPTVSNVAEEETV